ncbi:hypothetical protein AAE478_004345 [Parahypoxylon ruwenzoriense]
MLNWATSISIGSAEEWSLKSKHGKEYIVQIGFPRDWADYTPVPGDPGVPVVRLSMKGRVFSAGVVVAIGYPMPSGSRAVFNPRRTWDLTPPAPESQEAEGGADEFVEFINDQVKPFIRQRLADTRGAIVGKEALYGHSLGGLFCLHNLFTHADTFDCFIASSPSIWWNREFVLTEEAAFQKKGHVDRGNGKKKSSLMMFIGGQEQDPPRRGGESDEEHERRKRLRMERRMVDNVREMYSRLQASGSFENISAHVYEGEDHGTVISCSLSRGLTTFFEDWAS